MKTKDFNKHEIRADLIRVSLYLTENSPFDYDKKHIEAKESLHRVIKTVNELIEKDIKHEKEWKI